ncbi:hypothetical protein ACIPJS_04990 [Streptomyces sp. NPDC086783]|uniref:hypothetical protein n=1 Tax=Streptomyces sp. NPDC086783 TaxID=3365758 RepID=UPI0037F20C8F
MPKPLGMSCRTWVAAWAVLCAAGIGATAALNASVEPEAQPEKPVSAECAEYISDIETQLDRAKADGNDDGVLAFSRTTGGAEDCRDVILDHFGGGR